MSIKTQALADALATSERALGRERVGLVLCERNGWDFDAQQCRLHIAELEAEIAAIAEAVK